MFLHSSSSSLSFKCALRESGCRTGYEPTKNELRSILAVDIQGNQRGGFCIVPVSPLKQPFIHILLLACALKQSMFTNCSIFFSLNVLLSWSLIEFPDLCWP